jgi:integrase
VVVQGARSRKPEQGSAFEELRRALAEARHYLDETAGAPIQLDSARIAAFLAWSRRERQNTEKYVREQEKYLGWWATRLSGVDLRELRIAGDVLPHLDELAGGRAPRIAMLKVFCSWLHRERHELERDPVAALKIPQPRPAQWRRRRIVLRDELEGARRQLPAWARDAVTVLCGTGWHLAELVRFAAAGEISAPPPWARTSPIPVAGVLETVHKHGERWRTPVSRQVLAAAKRVRARGLDEWALRKALRRACDRAGVPRWTPGRLRHTVATWAIRQGESLQRVAEFLGHRDSRTTRRFYVDVFVPRRVRTMA